MARRMKQAEQAAPEPANDQDAEASPQTVREDEDEADALSARKAEEGAPAVEVGDQTEKTPPSRSRRKLAAIVLLPLLAGVGFYQGYQYWIYGRFQVSTDDAYIGADIATLSAKVSGYVIAVEVGDHARVKRGDVIAKIDDGDYRLAVQTVKDQIATQNAALARMDSQIAAQDAAIEQARAQLTAAEADLKRAALELERQQGLAKRDYTSRQTLENAQSQHVQAEAAQRSAHAAIAAAEANRDVLKAQKSEAEGALKQLRTALARAERDLSFTVIRAPFDGVVGNRAMQTGDFVQPGQRLASLVPLDTVYIDANFKETQLERLRPGQPVEIAVDALPDHIFEGRVVSFSPASGSVFSLLPPENATGNFTKVVQRVPVRIRVDQRAGEPMLLRPGMSVVVSVNTKQDGGTDASGLAASASSGSR